LEHVVAQADVLESSRDRFAILMNPVQFQAKPVGDVGHDIEVSPASLELGFDPFGGFIREIGEVADDVLAFRWSMMVDGAGNDPGRELPVLNNHPSQLTMVHSQ